MSTTKIEHKKLSVWDMIQTLDKGRDLQTVRRNLALLIFEITPTSTGWTSSTLLTDDGYRKTGKGIKSPTGEHFLNLKKYTIKMCEDYLSGKIDSFEKLSKRINQINVVHKVTSSENNRLREVQNKYPDLYWKEHYKMVGITLVKEVGTYNVDTKKYTNKRK